METASIPGINVEVSKRSLGYNTPQRAGVRLWLPMLVMALMAFPAALGIGIVRADEISSGGNADTIETLRHLQAGVMIIGFAAVFAAISFAIARILGQFRKGGGELHEAAGVPVQTMKPPATVKVFIGLMIMAMMTLVVAGLLHFVFAADLTSTASSLETSAVRFTVLDGIQTIGIAMYLVAITFGLATIARVIRFQSTRIRELAEERVEQQ